MFRRMNVILIEAEYNNFRIMKRERIFLYLVFLVFISCASTRDKDANVDVVETDISEQPILVSDTEIETLDSFEDFEDKFSAAAGKSVISNFVDKDFPSSITIYFDFNSAFLALDGRKTLDKTIGQIIKAIGKNKATRVRLEGHTDERGSDEYNLALGQRRADSVSRYMLLEGIPTNNMEVISYGETRPMQTGSGEIAWQENRRVEIRY